MADVQPFLVIALVLGAALYLGRRGWVSVMSALRQRQGRGCAAGCGCGHPE